MIKNVCNVLFLHMLNTVRCAVCFCWQMCYEITGLFVRSL